MSKRNSLKQRPTTILNLKKVLIYTVVIGSSFIGGYIVLALLGVIGAKSTINAQYTPGSGPIATGYLWSKQLTIDSTKVVGSNNMIDFPVLVHVTDPDFKSVGNGGKVENVNGYDIVFVGANSSLLDHQIEEYNPVNGELFAWVRVPVLYASVNTEIDVMYGSPVINVDPSTDAVWNGNYVSVWHMDNDPSNSNLIDAAGENDGEPQGMDASNSITGVIGPAIEFDGINDRFAIQNINYNTPGCIPVMTVTAWVNTTHSSGGRSDNWSLLDFDRSENFNVYIHGDGRASFSSRASTGGIDDFNAGNTGQVSDGNWHHVAMVYDGIDKNVYIDGVLAGTNSNAHGGSSIGRGNVTRFAFIGDGSEASSFNGSRNNKNFEGKMDEIHYFAGSLSADWIATEYNNQISPETFITMVGAPSPLPIELTSFEAWDNGNSEVEIEWVVASQINNAFFTVEKSIDGVHFESFKKVKGVGTSSVTMKYGIIDTSPANDVNYYRLKQTDFNGEFEIFKTIPVDIEYEIDNTSKIKIYPNPFDDRFTVEYELKKPNDLEVLIYNTQGEQVFYEEIQGEVGVNEYLYREDVNLIKGIYILNVLADGKSIGSSKLIKR